MIPLVFKKHHKTLNTRCPPHNIDTKQWDRRFFNRRTPSPHRSLIEAWREYDTSGDLLDIFLRHFGDQTPSWVAELVKEFCRSTTIFRSNGRAVQARARLCDIEIPSRLRRKHANWLTAEEMRALLKEKVCRRLN